MSKNDLVENIDINIASGPKVQKIFSIQFNLSPETLCHSQLLALALWNHCKNGI